MKVKQEQYVVRCMKLSEAKALFIGMDMRGVYPMYWLRMWEVTLSDWNHAILAGCKLAVSPTPTMKITCDLYKMVRR